MTPDLVDRILQTPRQGLRRIVALAGPPASGKSTKAEILVADLNKAGCAAALVPMDGYHLHNPILEKRGVLNRKGAPETFDVGGFARLIGQLVHEPHVYFPIFDRRRDIAIAGAGYVNPSCDTIVVEGNYLLMDAPGWRGLFPFWDLTVMLHCPPDVLEARLVQRWLDYELSAEEAKARAEENDLPNARLVLATAKQADVILPSG